MNKINNNLNIDNLMKTDLYKDFEYDQKKEIRLGLEKGLDVSIYAKKDFIPKKMKQIRLGLEDNLDVSVYSNKSFTWLQMTEIR